MVDDQLRLNGLGFTSPHLTPVLVDMMKPTNEVLKGNDMSNSIDIATCDSPYFIFPAMALFCIMIAFHTSFTGELLIFV